MSGATVVVENSVVLEDHFGNSVCKECMRIRKILKQPKQGGAWVAQLVKHLTLDFGSGHDLRVMRSALSWAPRSVQNLFAILCLSLCPPPTPSKVNK